MELRRRYAILSLGHPYRRLGPAADSELNPRLCALLDAFDRYTGLPVLLNTSFNDNEGPIVETPADALRCFMRTGMDQLVLGDLVRKADLP